MHHGEFALARTICEDAAFFRALRQVTQTGSRTSFTWREPRTQVFSQPGDFSNVGKGSEECKWVRAVGGGLFCQCGMLCRHQRGGSFPPSSGYAAFGALIYWRVGRRSWGN